MRAGHAWLLLVITGCNGDVGPIGEVECRLDVSPTLSDAGDVAVGETATLKLTLAATDADCRVNSINVLNIDGDYFYYGEPGDTDAEDNPTSALITIPKDSSVDVEVSYLPRRTGWHRAQVKVGSDHRDGEIQVDVRGHADEPDVTVFPLTVDFGMVPAGTQRIERVTVRNDSSLRLYVTRAEFNPSELFYSPEAFPIVIEPTFDAELEVVATPVGDDAELGSLVLLVGEVPLPPVRLRMNDCRNGTPDAYDRDADGFTTCGGDCRDDNDAINPGASEVPDGVDNDCNGAIDDGTSAYDDDADGYCDHPTICALPGIFPGDCNDGDPNVNPGRPEVTGDGVDNDCDGQVDGGSLDFDGDGYTEAAGDCDPLDGTVFPGAPELADGVDNDCDTFRDEGTLLYDDDGDGFCEGLPGLQTPCTDGAVRGDCDDTHADTHPGAPELPDWRDNNCDPNHRVDEGTRHYDDDGDGYTEDGGDCDDADADVGPNQLEIPNNGTDDDCNPATPVGQPQ